MEELTWRIEIGTTGFKGGQILSTSMRRMLGGLVALAVLSCHRSESLDSSSEAGGSKRATAPYEAYSNASGPPCGIDARTHEVRCEPLDNCVSEAQRQCEPSSDLYQAYSNAGGFSCGVDKDTHQVECQPRHTCADMEKSLCRPGS